MGRFDALTQIEEKPQRSAPSPVTSSPAVNNLQSPPIKKQVETEKKSPQTRKTANQQNRHLLLTGLKGRKNTRLAYSQAG